jgi:hypothetical protein
MRNTLNTNRERPKGGDALIMLSIMFQYRSMMQKEGAKESFQVLKNEVGWWYFLYSRQQKRNKQRNDVQVIIGRPHHHHKGKIQESSKGARFHFSKHPDSHYLLQRDSIPPDKVPSNKYTREFDVLFPIF